MFIIRYAPVARQDPHEAELFYATKRSDLTSVIGFIREDRPLEEKIHNCQYCEFNTREVRAEMLGPWYPLSELLIAKPALIPTEVEGTEE